MYKYKKNTIINLNHTVTQLKQNCTNDVYRLTKQSGNSIQKKYIQIIKIMTNTY